MPPKRNKAPKKPTPSEEFSQITFKGEDLLMVSSTFRLESFKVSGLEWPFDDDCSCTPEKMAEAGFYLVGTEKEPDLVRCYWCRRELDGWEPQDDPWAEHARRACPFIKLGKKPKELTIKDLSQLENAKNEILREILTQANEPLEAHAEEARIRLEQYKQPKSKPRPKRKARA